MPPGRRGAASAAPRRPNYSRLMLSAVGATASVPHPGPLPTTSSRLRPARDDGPAAERDATPAGAAFVGGGPAARGATMVGDTRSVCLTLAHQLLLPPAGGGATTVATDVGAVAARGGGASAGRRSSP